MLASALRVLGTSALLVAGLSACSGPASTSEPGTGSAATASSSATASGSATAASSAPAPTPTPHVTPAQKYTSTELAALVGQLRDAGGKKFSVMSTADLSGSLEQAQTMMASIAVEPAACRELAVAGAAPSVEGAAAAMGTSLEAATGVSMAVSLTSGLDAAFLQKGVAESAELSKCAKMSMTMSGMKVSVTLTKLSGIGSVPGTMAYRTDTALPDGQKQSMITAQAVQGGVLITVLSAGGASEEDAVSRTGKLLDSAAALVK